MSKQIEIVVIGGAGSGRSQVLGVISNALKLEYGQLADVAFSGRVSALPAEDNARPDVDNTVFLLSADEPAAVSGGGQSLKVFAVVGLDIQATRVMAAYFHNDENGLHFFDQHDTRTSFFPHGFGVVDEGALCELVDDPSEVGINIKVDTSAVDEAVGKVETLQGMAATFALDPLEQAIEAAVRLKADAKGADVARLRYHLEHLLALQLENLSSQYRKPVVISDWDHKVLDAGQENSVDLGVKRCVVGSSLAIGSRGIAIDPKFHGA